ncbi:hypothetical protein AA313_de0205406 [Arthrobotrys entomopaga]|nr:hypothetical protein AA313_de0205406 [Arthrobotrys entomopaga]
MFPSRFAKLATTRSMSSNRLSVYAQLSSKPRHYSSLSSSSYNRCGFTAFIAVIFGMCSAVTLEQMIHEYYYERPMRRSSSVFASTVAEKDLVVEFDALKKKMDLMESQFGKRLDNVERRCDFLQDMRKL